MASWKLERRERTLAKIDNSGFYVADVDKDGHAFGPFATEEEAGQVIVRQGNVTAKANKTDPVFQTFAVHQLFNGRVEYYHKQNSKWYKLPTVWESEVRWEN